MPVRRRSIARVLRELTWDQKLDLLIGPGRRDAFANDEERRLAWATHKDSLLASVNYIPGQRCPAWWDYDSPEPYADDDWEDLAEARHLRRMGILSEQEIADFERLRHVSIDDRAPSEIARGYMDSLQPRRS